tara:strand:- start:468 stop:851 length:384 start_codon:yes stop_codon:yes gene_type:complete
MLVSFVGADQFPSILGPRHAASIPLRLDPVKGGRSTKRALEEQERKEAERSMKRRVNLMDEFTRAAGSDDDDDGGGGGGGDGSGGPTPPTKPRGPDKPKGRKGRDGPDLPSRRPRRRREDRDFDRGM